jgi:hypothetical protein
MLYVGGICLGVPNGGHSSLWPELLPVEETKGEDVHSK